MSYWRIENRSSGLDLGVYRGAGPGEARDAMARDAGYADYDAAEAAVPGYVELVVTDAGQPCACGCGEYTTRSTRLLREQDRGTAMALGWAESSIRPMRVDVWLVAGHDEDGLDGYVTDEGGQ